MTISNVKLLAKNGILVTYVRDGKTIEIPFSALTRYWDYANENDMEGGCISIIEDRFIIGSILVASGQGGIVYIWNLQKEKLVHVSECAFVITSTIFNGMVYSICASIQWGVPGHFVLCRSKFGIMDALTSCECLDCKIPFDFDDYDGNVLKVNLSSKEGKLYMILNDVQREIVLE